MNRARSLRTTLVILVLLPAASAWGTALDVKASGPKTFYVDQRVGANQVVISSESTIEDYTAVINTVTGQFDLDPKNLEAAKGKFSIHVADIHTGVDLRDKELQGPAWIDAAKYPLITITIKGTRNVQKKSPNSAALTLIATFAMHGVTKDMEIPATLIYLDESPITRQRAQGDLIAVRAPFTFNLSDFNINGPTSSERTIGLKVADVQQVRVSIFASSVQPPPSLEGYGGLAPSGGATSGPASNPAAPRPAAPDFPALPLPPRPSAG